MAKGKEVATRKAGAVTTAGKKGFAARAGHGMENTTADSFAIPFLAILQKGSPQVDEAGGKQLKGAKAGMIFETVSQKLHDGKEGIELVQCGYKRVFLRWGAREAGGGFKGEFKPEEAAKMRQEGLLEDFEGRTYFKDKDGSFNPKKSDRLVDTRVHFMAKIDRKKGTFMRAVLSLSSTQVRKSKHLMSVFVDLKKDDGEGGEYTPATYQSILRMTTVPESNDMGNWYGVQFELAGEFEDPEDPLFLKAEEFAKIVSEGKANVKYEDADEGSGETGKNGKF